LRVEGIWRHVGLTRSRMPLGPATAVQASEGLTPRDLPGADLPREGNDNPALTKAARRPGSR
jgi:hypothetical protein